jgi:hypothetical protein
MIAQSHHTQNSSIKHHNDIQNSMAAQGNLLCIRSRGKQKNSCATSREREREERPFQLLRLEEVQRKQAAQGNSGMAQGNHGVAQRMTGLSAEVETP